MELKLVKEKGVIDRIVDGKHAVLLVGDTEKEFVIPVQKLPSKAKEGTWLRLELDGEIIHSVDLDEETTVEQKNRIQNKMALLRERGRINKKIAFEPKKEDLESKFPSLLFSLRRASLK